jgi:exosortase/archaeosortase family protein
VTVPTPQGPFTVAVSEACAGGGAVLGGGLLAATVWLVTEAPLRRKLAWSLLAVVGCWVGNLLRLGVLFGVGAKAGPEAMLGPVHTWLGGIVLALTLAVALATTGRFGLSFHVTRTHPEPLACLTRIDRAGALLGVAALAVLAVPVADATTHFDFLAGASRLPAASAMATVPRIDGVQALAPVAWAPAFFGSGSEWERWLVFAPADPSGRPVGIDVVRSTEPSRFDQYGLAACYGFHGYTILEQGTTSLPGGRIGERIVYRDPDSREIVTVLSWRQYVSRDELERVVVQRRSANGGEPDKASVRAVATRLLTSGGAA